MTVARAALISLAFDVLCLMISQRIQVVIAHLSIILFRIAFVAEDRREYKSILLAEHHAVEIHLLLT